MSLQIIILMLLLLYDVVSIIFVDNIRDLLPLLYSLLFFVNHTATTEIYTYLHTLSLHDALPILGFLEITMDRGEREGWFTSGLIVSTATISVVSLLAL